MEDRHTYIHTSKNSAIVHKLRHNYDDETPIAELLGECSLGTTRSRFIRICTACRRQTIKHHIKTEISHSRLRDCDFLNLKEIQIFFHQKVQNGDCCRTTYTCSENPIILCKEPNASLLSGGAAGSAQHDSFHWSVLFSCSANQTKI